eukprot:243287-Chlamydomonas_euryale.AAC.8
MPRARPRRGLATAGRRDRRETGHQAAARPAAAQAAHCGKPKNQSQYPPRRAPEGPAIGPRTSPAIGAARPVASECRATRRPWARVDGRAAGGVGRRWATLGAAGRAARRVAAATDERRSDGLGGTGRGWALRGAPAPPSAAERGSSAFAPGRRRAPGRARQGWVRLISSRARGRASRGAALGGVGWDGSGVVLGGVNGAANDPDS